MDGLRAWEAYRPENLKPARPPARTQSSEACPEGDDSNTISLQQLDQHTLDVPVDEIAIDHLLEFRNQVEEIRRTGNQWTKDLRARDHEKALRLALIKACSDGGPVPGLRITLEAARWACEFVDWQSRWLLEQAEDRIVDKTPLTHSEQVAKVRRWLRDP